MARKVKASKIPDSAFIDSSLTLGELIKAKRTSMGIKLSDCAALCGIGINTLSRIENGNENCTLSATFAALNGLGIKLSTQDLTSTASPNDEWV
jgi:transcriptional regulator with XRE-family HTH domain